ncbi:hypothetical protein COV42_00235 [Candidatus Campbellbacteria bacterium CG11_big_fil_rev_8_21_14_0_20_44_21]|uniref:Uncharacterized protein n=1 Tax=Candidatus Campbellbacteria bacterium CG22_combo_CG10-13_8_21_14_all_43_18 TaxID=1974530 RepID=A0A2H0DWQ5_9BACT|nr:MAG: hypothetical protein COW82_01155 [Candidatus Campbellbacteria bacterium CG22_combo_CG10-13_8_21_14_all_43_18]PIR24505.1 MAG: hypothetical protein COV42_00235 [Candidatus Campbellbacteria bacterium CG11_big_fil_rev_8_21_14_0_20_44_21]
MKNHFLKIKFLFLSFFFLFLPQILLGRGSNPTPPSSASKLKNPVKFNSIETLLSAFLEFVVKVGGIAVTLAIIYAGFKFVRAQGNSTKIEEAKKILMYVFIGAAIILGAEALRIVISGTVSNIQSGTTN